MTADVELPPLPETRFWADSVKLDAPGVFFEHRSELFVKLNCQRTVEFDQPLYTDIQVLTYVAHATAAKDAEIEALTAEVERLDAIVQNREAIIGTHAADTRQYQQHLMRAEARAERLAEALRLARNRLQRLALECPHESSIRYDANEWAGEATATLHPTAAQEGKNDGQG